MKNLNYKFRETTLADIPELNKTFKGTLHAINKADYTHEKIEDTLNSFPMFITSACSLTINTLYLRFMNCKYRDFI